MKIRFANRSDKKEVIDLLEELSQYLKQTNIPRPDTIFDEIIVRDDIKLFVAEDNGKIIGMASFYILPCIRHNYNRGHIEELVVSESSRGQGVGSKILEAIKDFCREEKIKIFKVETGNELIDTHRFYEKNNGVSKQKVYKFEV